MKKQLMFLVFCLSAALVGLSPALAAEVCFYEAGTYGNIEVTESGNGCGNTIQSRVWLGDGNSDESCEFSISPAIAGDSIVLTIDALDEDYPSYAEELVVYMNGAQVPIGSGDIISGGFKPSTGGIESPTLGGLNGGPIEANDGSIRFGSAPDAVNSIELRQNWIIGGPNGTLYQICVDDTEVGPPPVEEFQAVPASSALTKWILILTLVLSAGFIGFRQFK